MYKLIRQAQKYSVNLYEDALNRLWDENAIYEVRKGTGIYYLAEENYDDNLGLIENQSKMSTMNFKEVQYEKHCEFKVWGRYALFTDPVTK